MKHYRILEKKIINDITNGVGKKEYIIQYLQKLFFGLYYWKKLNNVKYYKYEEAFNEVKQLINQSDYDNEKFGYHYVDAYKVFKVTKEIQKKEEPIEVSATVETATLVETKTVKETPKENKKNVVTKEPPKDNKRAETRKKSTFIPKTKESVKTNKSTFIPK